MSPLIDRDLLRLAHARGPGGTRVDVDCAGGRIVAVHPGGASPGAGPVPGRLVDLSGMLLLPALVEPHAHIDKAYTADLLPNPTGDLAGAIEVSQRIFVESSCEDIERRARRALAAYAARGCLVVRTHVALGSATGLRTIEGVLRAAAAFSDFLEVQIVAHISPPLVGPAGRQNRELLRQALALGADLVGGTPYRAAEPEAETDACLEEAAAAGVPVDLHTDETLEVSKLTVRYLAERVRLSGFPHPVTASHCVSLGMQEPSVQAAVAELLAESGVAVVSLPQTNLYLQSRQVESAKPRGLTALSALYAAGARVAAGGDNVQDPFNPMGRGDPLEAASLLVTAGHLDPELAFEAVSAAAREVVGAAPVRLEVGSPADLVAVPGSCLREAIAECDSRRVVVRRGAVLEPSELSARIEPWELAPEVAGV